MLYVAIIILLILCFPINTSGHSLAVAENRYILQNLKVGLFPVFAIGVELTDNGWAIHRNNKTRIINRKNKAEDSDDKKNRAKTFQQSISTRQLSQVRIRHFSIRGSFGCQNNALTGLICSSSIIISSLIYSIIPNIEQFEVDIQPVFNKSTLQLNLKFKLQFNLLIIFFLIINILFKNFKDKES